MTEAELKEFLEESKNDIQAAVKQAAIERLLEQHRWDITDQISKAVSEFVAADIIPEVQKELASQKGVIVDTLIASFATLSDDLAKGLTKDTAKCVSDDWQRKKIIKALFDIH
ncbi:MAG: hypothetical protein RIC14_05415 [Filomicrobium sp.]